MPDKVKTNPSTRRAFLGTAAVTAASYQRILGANDRIGVGFVGFGLIGKQHVADFKKFNDVDIAGVCDVYKPRVDEALAYIANPNTKGYADFRKMYESKDIQGIVVATPDHWHALLTILACAAGKDVYVEKPMTVCVDEGKWMIQAARKHNRIVSVGTQRRHGKGVAAARKVVESGALGKIHSVRMAAFRNIYPGFGKTPVSDPPAGLDYDMWLGPAPKRPYTAHRGLYHFRWFWDYSGGQMTNLGAHIIDQVFWIMDVKGPTLVMSTGGRYALEDDGETPDVQDASWVFPTFTMHCAIREANASRGDPGQAYLGTKGSMTITGSYQVATELKGDPVDDIPKFQGQPIGGPVYSNTAKKPWIEPSSGGVASDSRYGTGGEDTMSMNERDWLDCMRSRKRPLCEVEDGHRVSTACNLANMSLRLGRSIRWDPEKEQVIGDREAAAMCVRPYRAPWDAALRGVVKV
ncbi:MAG: Gfo/Idh/MocA family oxidoreductase [Candidatus Sulfopaludibacter sp.]|nr:Gfo/Idh/MocA family oxidoreductase [Candidatus Sulfopaludibacter sp.]